MGSPLRHFILVLSLVAVLAGLFAHLQPAPVPAPQATPVASASPAVAATPAADATPGALLAKAFGFFGGSSDYEEKPDPELERGAQEVCQLLKRVAPGTRGKFLTLNPNPVTSGSSFHGFPVLGQVPLSGAETPSFIKATITIVEKAAKDYLGSCFKPRHGIRLDTAQGPVDLLICFQCSKIKVYAPQKSWTLDMSDDTQAFFDEAVRKRGLPFDRSE